MTKKKREHRRRQNKYPRLTIHEIAEGMKLCLLNAGELIDDADFLFDNERYARALACLCMADQEIGKITTLHGMANIGKHQQKLWTTKWKRFRDHRSKTTQSFVSALTSDSSLTMKQVLESTFRHYFRDSRAEEELRRASIYVDYFDEHWRSPDFVTAEIVQTWSDNTLAAYKKNLQLYEHGFYSEKAIEIKHSIYAGKYDEDLETIKGMAEGNLDDELKNLHRRYFKRLIKEGLLSSDTEMQVFGVPVGEFINER